MTLVHAQGCKVAPIGGTANQLLHLSRLTEKSAKKLGALTGESLRQARANAINYDHQDDDDDGEDEEDEEGLEVVNEFIEQFEDQEMHDVSGADGADSDGVLARAAAEHHIREVHAEDTTANDAADVWVSQQQQETMERELKTVEATVLMQSQDKDKGGLASGAMRELAAQAVMETRLYYANILRQLRCISLASIFDDVAKGSYMVCVSLNDLNLVEGT